MDLINKKINERLIIIRKNKTMENEKTTLHYPKYQNAICWQIGRLTANSIRSPLYIHNNPCSALNSESV